MIHDLEGPICLFKDFGDGERMEKKVWRWRKKVLEMEEEDFGVGDGEIIVFV